jgi:cell division protease FtsH
VGLEERNYSEETARAIDAEVRAIVDRQHARARGILESRRELLERMAARLIEVETLDRREIDAIVGPMPAEPRGCGATTAPS